MSSLFKKFSPTQNYGFFGYKGWCCDIAVTNNNADMAEECWQHGWMDMNTETIMGTVLEKCDRHAPLVAARLRELGPCVIESEPVGA